jgi:hypothetical protein
LPKGYHYICNEDIPCVGIYYDSAFVISATEFGEFIERFLNEEEARKIEIAEYDDEESYRYACRNNNM